MDNRRPPARRLSELKGYAPEPRQSRVDQSKRSFIPRPANGDSLDRVSGVHPFESGSASVSRGTNRFTGTNLRHRSAESTRATIGHPKPRAESAQRPSFQNRHRSTILWETPKHQTPLSRSHARTPSSAASSQSHRPSHHRTPSSEQARTLSRLLEKAISALPGKDKRVVSDPSWQKCIGFHVVSKLREDPEINVFLPSGSAPLRPITIRLFLEITNCLLSKLGGARFLVTGANYVQKLPSISQKLLYPGIMSKSWLKSVNAMHTYPNVLAFLSYLIDLADVRLKIQESTGPEKLYGEGEQGEFLTLRHQYYFQTWNVFQENLDFDNITCQYIDELKKLHNLSEDDCQKRKEELAELKEKKNNVKSVHEKLKQNEHCLYSESNNLKNRDNYLREQNVDLEKQFLMVERCVEIEKIALEHSKQRTCNLQNQLASLKERLFDPNATSIEQENMSNDADFLNEIANSKEKLYNQMEQDLFKRDIELVAEQKKALGASIEFNKSLMIIGLAAGRDLSSHSLMKRELLSEETPMNIKETNNKLKELLIEAEKQLQETRDNNDSGAFRLQQLKGQIEALAEKNKTLEKQQSILEKNANISQLNISAAKNRRNAAISKKKQSQELKTKGRNILKDAKDQMEYWIKQDEKWLEKLEQLRSEENMVNEICKKRKELLISEYVKLANSILK